MYRAFGTQHGYEPIGSEPRMYRTYGAQHGYDVFDIGTTKSAMS